MQFRLSRWLGIGTVVAGASLAACVEPEPTLPTGSGGSAAGCPAGTTWCGTVCVDLTQNGLHCGACDQACPAAMSCVAATCACVGGLVACADGCRDLTNDANHCGGCGIACAAGTQSCVNGACACRGGLTPCSGACVDVASDPAHCGGCGVACGTGQVCSLGACGASCAAGLTQCGQSCVDVTSSVLHCGGCGVTCGAAESCQAGACTCEGGLTSCSGACVDTASDPYHCGGCGVVCTGGTTCQGGSCACPAGQTLCEGACVTGECTTVGSGGSGGTGGVAGTGGVVGGTGGTDDGCPEGQALCDGACVDVLSDPLRCGACDVQCVAPSTCLAGACTCPAGTDFCAGACVDTRTSAAHCGACGAACPRPATCEAGVCTCAGGQLFCGDACVDPLTDPAHCGACDEACLSGECVDGACTPVKDCFQQTFITAPLFTDFETYDGTTAADTWGFAFNAPAGAPNAVYAGPYHFDDGSGTQTLAMIAGHASEYALAIHNPSATEWGGALAFWSGCFDASAYQGLKLWVRGTAPSGTASLSLTMEATSAPSEENALAGGTCEADCEPASIEFPVTSVWSEVLLPWASFTPGSANGAEVPVTGAGITGMTFSVPLEWVASDTDPDTYVPSPAAVGLEVDDLRFIESDACPSGQILCGLGCVDVRTDAANCGACGRVCEASRACVDGACACPTGYQDCGGECVDTSIDAQNCGRCGNSCSGECAGGACQTSACTPGMPHQGETCTAYAAIDAGKYWINNNVWGADGAAGSQCIWSTCISGNTIGWGTSYSWSGAASQVKSYASAVLGWHWGWRVPSGTGLPVPLSANRTITCAWTYRVPTSGTFNVAYDLWAHDRNDPGTNDDPTEEIMIWLHRGGGAGAIGTLQTTASLAGTSWELYRGNNGHWNVYSYVRAANTNSATLNLGEFLADLVTRGWMSSSRYLSSIEAGTEVFLGSGEINTDQYYCTIE